MMDEKDKTLTFSLNEDKGDVTRGILLTVYAALIEKGYDPINQIVVIFCLRTLLILPTIKMQEVL